LFQQTPLHVMLPENKKRKADHLEETDHYSTRRAIETIASVAWTVEFEFLEMERNIRTWGPLDLYTKNKAIKQMAKYVPSTECIDQRLRILHSKGLVVAPFLWDRLSPVFGLYNPNPLDLEAKYKPEPKAPDTLLMDIETCSPEILKHLISTYPKRIQEILSQQSFLSSLDSFIQRCGRFPDYFLTTSFISHLLETDSIHILIKNGIHSRVIIERFLDSGRVKQPSTISFFTEMIDTERRHRENFKIYLAWRLKEVIPVILDIILDYLYMTIDDQLKLE